MDAVALFRPMALRNDRVTAQSTELSTAVAHGTFAAEFDHTLLETPLACYRWRHFRAQILLPCEEWL